MSQENAALPGFGVSACPSSSAAYSGGSSYGGVTATPCGASPEATLAGVFLDSFPPVPTLYWTRWLLPVIAT